MAQRISRAGIRRSNRIPTFALASLAALLLAGALTPHRAALAATGPAPATSATALNPAAGETVLLNALDAELKRAMSSLGSDGAAGAQQPRPYFLSYDVSEARIVDITAEYGAITNSRESPIRLVDVQVRLGSPAEDNTHGDLRNSALTSIDRKSTRLNSSHLGISYA